MLKCMGDLRDMDGLSDDEIEARLPPSWLAIDPYDQDALDNLHVKEACAFLEAIPNLKAWVEEWEAADRARIER